MIGLPPELVGRLRTPLRVTAFLLCLLCINGLLGWLAPHPYVWIAEAAIAVTMVTTVILIPMEVIHEPPIIRLFSALGFFWVAILFGLTVLDYLTR